MDTKMKSMIEEIVARLDSIEQSMMFRIPAADRFIAGDRVRWSKIAERNGLRSKARTGVVVAVDGLSIKARMLGQKSVRKCHHMMFDDLHPTPDAAGG